MSASGKATAASDTTGQHGQRPFMARRGQVRYKVAAGRPRTAERIAFFNTVSLTFCRGGHWGI